MADPYTSTGLIRLARQAASAAAHRPIGYADRVDIALSAIGEHLAVSGPCDPGDLVHVGARAVDREVEALSRSHGVNGSTRMPRFDSYWQWVVRHRETHEERTIEHLALAQIWPLLRPYERNAIAALAMQHGDHRRAATAIGVPLATLHTYLARARKTFYAWWFHPETPRRKWDSDRGDTQQAATITSRTIRARRASRGPGSSTG